MATDDPPKLTPLAATLRGLTRRCPLCARRGIFETWFRQVERCPTCNFPTARSTDQWIGALGMNTIVSFSLLVGVLLVGFIVTYPDPPVGPLLVATITVAVVVPIGFYPVSKSLWSGIDLAMTPPNPDDDIDPRWIPPRTRTRRP